MMIPTIHRNGSDPDVLLDQVVSAALALDTAERKLSEACPNARDYYVQGHDAYLVASREHVSRMERLSSVLRELQDLAEAIAEAKDAREARRAVR